MIISGSPTAEPKFEPSCFIFTTNGVYALCGSRAETPTVWSDAMPPSRLAWMMTLLAREASFVSLP